MVEEAGEVKEAGRWELDEGWGWGRRKVIVKY